MIDPLERKKEESKGIWFTWCNNQASKQRIYCKLDKIYVDAYAFSFVYDKANNPITITPVIMYDHSPIYTIINVDDRCQSIGRPRKNNVFKLNTSLLKDGDTLGAIKMATCISKFYHHELSVIERWDVLVSLWRKLFQFVGEKTTKDRYKLEEALQTRLNKVEVSLRKKGHKKYLEGELIKKNMEMSKIKHTRFKGQSIRARLNWLKGDKGFNYFFNIIRHKQKRERIEEITLDGGITNNLENFGKAFFDFYKNLF